jgi:hypothetical protein
MYCKHLTFNKVIRIVWGSHFDHQPCPRVYYSLGSRLKNHPVCSAIQEMPCCYASRMFGGNTSFDSDQLDKHKRNKMITLRCILRKQTVKNWHETGSVSCTTVDLLSAGYWIFGFYCQRVNYFRLYTPDNTSKSADQTLQQSESWSLSYMRFLETL